jgi:hypothetical protein
MIAHTKNAQFFPLPMKKKTVKLWKSVSGKIKTIYQDSLAYIHTESENHKDTSS